MLPLTKICAGEVVRFPSADLVAPSLNIVTIAWVTSTKTIISQSPLSFQWPRSRGHCFRHHHDRVAPSSLFSQPILQSVNTENQYEFATALRAFVPRCFFWPHASSLHVLPCLSGCDRSDWSNVDGAYCGGLMISMYSASPPCSAVRTTTL